MQAQETWRKYVIDSTQPSASPSAQQPGARPETREHDDYQALLVRFQTLELEVKLLKDAFKMHINSTPVQSHQAQLSCLAIESKNSDSLAQSSPRNSPLAPAMQEQEVQIKHESQELNNTTLNWRKPPELHAPKHDKDEDARTPASHLMSDCGVYDCLHPSPLKHTIPSSPACGSRVRDISDQTTQADLQPYQHLAVHDSLRGTSKLPQSSTERVSRGVSGFDKIRPRIKELLAEDSAVRLPVDGTPAISSLQQTIEDLETRTLSSPFMPSQQPALKSLLDIEAEAEIARFPTIFQLEKEGLRSAKSKSVAPQDSVSAILPLTRANTVTCSNPAARLLKPFDPATESLGIQASQDSLPRRSGTERYRHRPHAAQYSGTGGTLWEGFERSGPQAQSTISGPAQKLSDQLEPRPLNDFPQHDNPSIIRSQSLNHHHPANHLQLPRLFPRRSPLDLSGTQRNGQDLPPTDQLRQRPIAANSAPDLAQQSTPDPNYKRSKSIQNCITTLQRMGYEPHSRLPVYAEACNGNIHEAVTMADDDDRATQETEKLTKILSCVRHLKEMGYGAEHCDEGLEIFASNAKGDVGLAVESIEGADSGPNGGSA